MGRGLITERIEELLGKKSVPHSDSKLWFFTPVRNFTKVSQLSQVRQEFLRQFIFKKQDLFFLEMYIIINLFEKETN